MTLSFRAAGSSHSVLSVDAKLNYTTGGLMRRHMKNRKSGQAAIAAVMMAILIGGCGEAPYDLTEKEENIIVDYAAHIVAKYNSYQKDGLTWVDFEAVKESETAEADTEIQEDENTGENGSLQDDTAGNQAAESEAPGLQTATLNELFGIQGIQVDYTGAYLADNYMQEAYYAMYPDAGKQYLIVQIAVTNTSGADIEMDNLTLASTFHAVVNSEAEAASELTVLLEDFAQLQQTIAADATQDTVLLFQIPDTVSQIDSLTLSVTMNGESYQIIL